jgi:thioredoxin reductase
MGAALVLGRARRSVHLVDSGDQRNAVSAHMHGTLSRDGESPAAFYAAGRDELARYAVTTTTGHVDHLAAGDGDSGRRWTAHLSGGGRLTGRRLVVATGLVDRLPDVPGVGALWGRDVVSCPYCHGWEVAGAEFALLATRPAHLSRAVLLTQWSPRVRVFLHHIESDEIDADLREIAGAAGLEIVDGPVVEVVSGAGRLASGRTADGRSFAHPVLFVVPELVPRSELLAELSAELDDGGWPVVDPSGATSVPGVWAVGNAVSSAHKVIHAAASGATTAEAVNEDLLYTGLRVSR